MAEHDSRKVPIAVAMRNCDALRGLIGESVCDRWEIAGSARRLETHVGDVEHVVIPRFGDTVAPGTMFPDIRSMLWSRIDELIDAGEMSKWVYSDGSHRWGDIYRGVCFRDVRHEFFVADERNWGAILAIRTGPGWFSKMLVTRLHDTGSLLRMDRGYLRYCRGKSAGSIYSCPTEEAFFKACSLPFIPPPERSSYHAR